MINSIHVDATEPSVARILKGIGGREARIRPDLTSEPFRFSGNYWSGGTRHEYTVVDVATGERVSLPSNGFHQPDGESVIPQGYVVVEHGTFCGKRMVPTIHTHPGDLAGALPEPSSLSDSMVRVLCATAQYKNTYGGQTGIRQRHSGLSLEDWNTTQAEAIDKGFLRKNGSITREGRNAIEGHPYRLHIPRSS